MFIVILFKIGTINLLIYSFQETIISFIIINICILFQLIFALLFPFLHFLCFLYSSFSFLIEFSGHIWIVKNNSIQIILFQHTHYTKFLSLHKRYSFGVHEYCNFSEVVSLRQCLNHSLFISCYDLNLSFNDEEHFFSNLIFVYDIVSRHINYICQHRSDFPH